MPYRFQISANQLSWPHSCACCGADADAKLRAAASRTTGKRVQSTTTSWWEIPYCSRCKQHKRAFEVAAKWPWVGLGLVVAVCCLASMSTSAVGIGLVVAGALGLFSIFQYRAAKSSARALMLPTCCTETSAVQYTKWHGTFHTFVFASKSYLDLFLVANRSKKRSDITQV
jgi:hypothetical protein